MRRVLLLGGGGHAKCVIEAMRLCGRFLPAGVIDLKARVGEEVLGVKICGSDCDLPKYYARGVKLCFVTLGSTGDPVRRVSLWSLAEKAGFDFPNIIHPSASVSSYAELGRGIYIGPGAIVNAGAIVHDGAIINSNAVVEHDTRVGAFAHVAPGAILSGGVSVGDRTHLGTGCVVTHGVSIGAYAIVGVGAAVVKNMPGKAVYVGNPARKIRDL